MSLSSVHLGMHLYYMLNNAYLKKEIMEKRKKKPKSENKKKLVLLGEKQKGSWTLIIYKWKHNKAGQLKVTKLYLQKSLLIFFSNRSWAKKLAKEPVELTDNQTIEKKFTE